MSLLAAPLNPEKVVVVAAMSARMAHALHGLIEASRELKMMPSAAEICIYDFDAMSVRATAAALREASRLGYCANVRGFWVAANAALDLRYALEDRALRDEERND